MSLIKLDYDKITTRDVGLIFHHRAWLLKYFGIEKVICRQTTRGYHVRIVLKTWLPDSDVELVQILMGSDIHREIFNFLRRYNGVLIEEWNKLYTKKYIVLKTKIVEDLGGESECQILQDIVEEEIENAKDLRGYI